MYRSTPMHEYWKYIGVVTHSDIVCVDVFQSAFCFDYIVFCTYLMVYVLFAYQLFSHDAPNQN